MDLREDPTVLLGHLAAALAGGADLTAALELLVADAGLRSAVLRSAGPSPDLLAVAGDVVHAVPASRATGAALPDASRAEVELAVPDPSRPVAVLTVVGARPALLPLLHSAAAVLGLALAAPRRGDVDVRALVADADADGDALADALHDGPVQALVAARWACDAVVRGADPELAREAVQTAVVSLRHTLWHLRPRGAADLAAALSGLSSRLVEEGGPALQLVGDVRAVPADGPCAALAYRVVQSVARDAAAPVRVRLRAVDGGAVLDLDGGRPLGEPDRWRRRLRACGGDLSSSAGRLRVHLPASTATPRPADRPAVPTAVPVPSPLPGLRPGTDTKACS